MPADMPAVLLAAPDTGPRASAGPGSAVAKEVDAVFDSAIGWADLDWLASLSPLPILIKGILHPADAARAVDHGAKAILVSNHGGRQLDSAVAALDALPAVFDVVAGRIEVL